MPPALTLALLLLAGCEYAYGVTRHVEAPEGCEFSTLEDALRLEPGFSAVESVQDNLCLVRDGDAHASVLSDDHALWIGSIWINREPTADVLQRSMDLQVHLIRRMRSVVPAIPPEEAWITEWVNMEAQLDAAADESRDHATARSSPSRATRR
jgi:hypothetical protein